jgi:LmbE family N-acetylglucosaminyl deacetylase
MNSKQPKSVAVIVAHPDDETLWAGGMILRHPSWNWFIVSMCRASDTDRAPRFYETLKILNANGVMGDLDDGPQQKPLAEQEVENCLMDLLPSRHFDLIITHNTTGEYTRHLRHEEVSKAVILLWAKGRLSTNALWLFAYEDCNKKYLPKPVEQAGLFHLLPNRIWSKKHRIITQTYGFPANSWEAETTPKAEAFRPFSSPEAALKWLDSRPD